MAEAGFATTRHGISRPNGFRLRVGDVGSAWDGAGERALELQEAPLIWMDRALSKYAGVEDPDAWITEGIALADACRPPKGLGGVWHPNLTAALGFPDAPAAFAGLLDRLLARQPFLAPLGRLVDWRVARPRRPRARILPTAGRRYATRSVMDSLTLEDASGAGG